VGTIDQPTSADIDHFWAQFLELSCVEFGMEDYWDSVAQMSNDVEVVVVGHPVAVSVRENPDRWGEFAVIDVAIDEALKGTPASAQPGIIEITDEGSGSWWSDYPDGHRPDVPIPAVTTLLFLRNEAAAQIRYGYTPEPGDEYLYYMPGVHQNVLTELEGKVYVPQTPRMRRWYGNNFFPLPLEGVAWEKLINEVTSSATESAKPDGIRKGMLAAC
jgi:hypothetical protein